MRVCGRWRCTTSAYRRIRCAATVHPSSRPPTATPRRLSFLAARSRAQISAVSAIPTTAHAGRSSPSRRCEKTFAPAGAVRAPNVLSLFRPGVRPPPAAPPNETPVSPRSRPGAARRGRRLTTRRPRAGRANTGDGDAAYMSLIESDRPTCPARVPPNETIDLVRLNAGGYFLSSEPRTKSAFSRRSMIRR